MIEDWGDIPGDVLAFGGAVSNAHAMAALLALAGPGAALVSTGDHAAYCGEPGRTVALVRAARVRSIAGNCEESLGAGAVDCGCGFLPGSVCDAAAASWYRHCEAGLGAEDRRWMAGLPRLAAFRAHGRRWGVLHGGASQINRFVWESDPDAVLGAEIAAFEALAGPVDAILAGHSGRPFLREVGARLWFNTGSLGLPPHDGDPRTCFGLIGADGPRILRLGYDHRAAAAAMRRAGLTQGYEQTLESGWWPDETILPEALRRAG